ncbi:MAG: hypothetical protein HY673_06815 [Chloroflexi bacterium]|nr:hypothetical protein [Chloroflexota bacterium]
MWQFDSEFTEMIQRTSSVKSFRFPIGIKRAPYKPGQFFFLTIRINGQEALHQFSFSSSPTDYGYVEFTKRLPSMISHRHWTKCPEGVGLACRVRKEISFCPLKEVG